MASNIARYNRASGTEREHNAAKPVALLEWLIGNSSDEGDLVGDWFAGSGSTLIAAEKTRRISVNVELKQRHTDIIVARWERLTGKRAQRVPVEDMPPIEAEEAAAPAEEKEPIATANT